VRSQRSEPRCSVATPSPSRRLRCWPAGRALLRQVMVAPRAALRPRRPAAAPGEGGRGELPELRPPQARWASLANPAIDETSGLVASALHPGSYYLHNDSGDSARFFAIGPAGEDRGTYTSRVSRPSIGRTWPAAPAQARAAASISPTSATTHPAQRIRHPSRGRAGALEPGTRAVPFESFRYVYPDGARNAEALLVHPTTGAPIILTKDAGRTQLFELPLPLDGGRVATATLARPGHAARSLPLATACRLRARRLGHSRAHLYEPLVLWCRAGEGVAEALARMPCSLPVAGEQQGEAVAWALDGKSYVTVSEGVGAAINVAGAGRRARRSPGCSDRCVRGLVGVHCSPMSDPVRRANDAAAELVAKAAVSAGKDAASRAARQLVGDDEADESEGHVEVAEVEAHRGGGARAVPGAGAHRAGAQLLAVVPRSGRARTGWSLRLLASALAARWRGVRRRVPRSRRRGEAGAAKVAVEAKPRSRAAAARAGRRRRGAAARPGRARGATPRGGA
jgi:hypothetical protein